jgi:hypothetical protein
MDFHALLEMLCPDFPMSLVTHLAHKLRDKDQEKSRNNGRDEEVEIVYADGSESGGGEKSNSSEREANQGQGQVEREYPFEHLQRCLGVLFYYQEFFGEVTKMFLKGSTSDRDRERDAGSSGNVKDCHKTSDNGGKHDNPKALRCITPGELLIKCRILEKRPSLK